MTAPPLVFDIQRFCIHDGPGIRTTVFFKGCPLRCAWCQNPESQRRGPEIMFQERVGRAMTVDQILSEVLRDRAYYEDDGGLTVSGGEPLLHPRFVAELLRAAKAERLHTCVETCGQAPESAFDDVLPYTDLFFFDLKLLEPTRHALLTGAHHRLILANARKLVAERAPVQFRVPIVPGANDDRDNIDRTAAFLRELGLGTVRLVPYRGYYRDKERALGRVAAIEVDASLADARVTRAKEWFAEGGIAVEVDA